MEQSFVAWAKMRARRLAPEGIGIGDDAAVLANRSDRTVITVDTLCEGTHFDLAQCEPQAVGRKSVLVNLSDIAAMAAEPDALLLSLCLPASTTRQSVDALAAGLFEGVCSTCERFQIAVAGGDTNIWNGGVVISVTMTGHVVNGNVWRRGGAKPGDVVVVTGPLGGSILGKHLDFAPRLDIARALRDMPAIHAAMDISDGLSIDLRRMCDASRCGAIVDPQRVPIAAAAEQLAQQSGRSPLEHALGDGEDFELLLAVDPVGVTEVQRRVGEENAIVCGEFTSRTGLWIRKNGRIDQLPAIGYVHGGSPSNDSAQPPGP